MDANHLQAVKIAKALSDPTRYQLLRAVAAQDEISCAELVARFPVAQATVSHHLKVLAAAGLVTVRKSGQFHHYRAVPAALRAHAARLVEAFGPRRPSAPRRSRRAAPPSRTSPTASPSSRPGRRTPDARRSNRSQ